MQSTARYLPTRRIRREPLADKAFTVIEEAILRGKLPPGSRLKEKDLADSLGISRSPVREAVQRLAANGLLCTVPQRGVFVAQITAEKVSELMSVREVLEGLAARLASERLSTDQLVALRRTLEDIRERKQRGNLTGYPQRPLDFHGFLTQASGNATLQTTLKFIHRQLQLARSQSGADPARMQDVISEHLDVLEALEHRNADLAENQMRRHIQQARENMLRVMAAFHEGRERGKGEAGR